MSLLLWLQLLVVLGRTIFAAKMFLLQYIYMSILYYPDVQYINMEVAKLHSRVAYGYNY